MNEKAFHRLMRVVEVRGNVRTDRDPCWISICSTNSSGYGQIMFETRAWNTHRFSWWIHNGQPELNNTDHIAHHCDNKLCCNPSHLYKATPKENAADVWNRGLKVKKYSDVSDKPKTPCMARSLKGETNGRSILTLEQVKDIRKRYAEGFKYGEMKRLAEELGITYITIQKIVANKIWVDK
jgi:hypothetical protein